MRRTHTRLMTVPEVCDELHISRPTAYRWIADGRLAGVRLGDGPGRGQIVRVDPAAVDAYLQQRKAGR